MKRREFVRGGLATTLLAAGASARPAFAQHPAEPGFLCVVRLPCCSCTSNESPRIAIHTGTVPWRVTTPSSPYPLPANPVSPLPGPWTAALPPATWVGPPGANTTSPAPGNYTYEMQFYVPNCVIPSTITISGQMAADNSARVYIDANPTVLLFLPHPAYGAGAVGTFTTPPITGTGVHTLKVVVNNIGAQTGLLLRGYVNIACPSQTEDGEVIPSR